MALLVSELSGWLNHPVTQRIYRELKELRDNEADTLVSGSTLSDHARTAYIMGLIAGMDKFLKLDIKEFGNETESNGTQGPN